MTRKALATVIALAVVGYTAGVVSGRIDEHRRIDSVTLILIVLAMVVVTVIGWPELAARLKVVEISGFRLEMLEVVKRRQADQESRLQDIALILPLLLPENERRHLLNLAKGSGAHYEGGHSLRTELRRLRSIGLIGMLKDRHISELKDGTSFDLAHSVELTTFGRRWADRLKAMEAEDGKAGNEEGS